MLVGAALVSAPRARSAGALGAMAAGLALAALRAAAPSPVRLDRTSLSALPGGFVSVDAALVTLAVVLAVLALVEVGRRDRTPESLAGAGALAAGALAIAWSGRALPLAAPPGSLATALVVIAGAGTLLVLTGRRVRLPRRRESVTARPRSAVAGLALGALAVAAGPHLAAVFLGVVAAGWSGWLLRRAGGGSKVPVAPGLTLLLVPAYWLLATIAGPEGLRIGGLGQLPLSPAAELLLAPALLLAAWSLSGLWPLQRQQPGPLTAAVGVLLLVRVALPAVPDGMEHWRALVMPIIVIGLWHAALGGRWSHVAVAMAWVGAISPGRTGPAGAGLLLAGGLTLELAARLGAAHPRRATPARVAAALAAGWGALLAVDSSLHGEVVYTVLAVGGLVAAAGGWAGAQAMTASEPRTTAPSA
jgi:hypothetical protein